jgi:hypothetical protein
MSGAMLSVYALATCSAALGMLAGLLLPRPAVFLIVLIASVSGLVAAMVCAGLLVGASLMLRARLFDLIRPVAAILRAPLTRDIAAFAAIVIFILTFTLWSAFAAERIAVWRHVQ